MKDQRCFKYKGTLFFSIVLLLITGNIALTLNAMDALSPEMVSRLQATLPEPTYPTNYPPDKQILEAKQRQTQRAAALTLYPTGTIWSIPPVTFTPDPLDWNLNAGTPAGDGMIDGDGTDHGPSSLDKLFGIYVLNGWYARVEGKHFTVFAGIDFGKFVVMLRSV